MNPEQNPPQRESSSEPSSDRRLSDNRFSMSLEEFRDAVVMYLREQLDSEDTPPQFHPVWSVLPENFRVLIDNLLSAKPGLPALDVTPPVTFMSLQRNPQALPFLRALLENPPGAFDAYVESICPIEACHVATGLLRGGPKSRSIALFLLSTACLNDSLPGSSEAHLYANRIFSIALQFGSESDKSIAASNFTALSEYGSETWGKLLSQNLTATTNVAERHNVVEALLGGRRVKSFRTLLSVAISPHTDRDLSDRILTALIDTPLPGTPGLTAFLRKVRNTEDSSHRQAYTALISSIAGFAGDYWGHLAPWIFERPLRLSDNLGADPLQLHERLCPHVRTSAFLPAFNICGGGREALAWMNNAFAPSPDLPESEHSWHCEQLRQSLIRASFLTPFEHMRVTTALSSISSDPSRMVLVSDILSAAATRQRVDFPQLSVMRLMASVGELDKCPDFVRERAPISDDEADRRHREVFLVTNPLNSPLEQTVEMLESSQGTSAWLDTYSSQIKLLQLEPTQEYVPFSVPQYGTSPVHEFVRAATIGAPNADLLKLLGEALSHVDISGQEPRAFASWRYDEQRPGVARQLRSLSQESRAAWSSDLSAILEDEPIGEAIPVSELGGRSRYCVLLTDHPEIMFRIGKIPSLTAACTSFNNGAYYAQSIVSSLVDAHIKALVVLDSYKMEHLIAPQLPADFHRALKAGSFSPPLISKYFSALQLAMEARSIVKLVETTDGRPVLLMEPSFVKGTFNKSPPTVESLRFLVRVSEVLGTGVALRAYVDQKDFPLKVLVLPPSVSPGGQLENFDFAPWLATHHGATAISATLIKQPPR